MNLTTYKHHFAIQPSIPNWTVSSLANLTRSTREVNFQTLNQILPAKAIYPQKVKNTHPSFQEYFDEGMRASNLGDWRRAAEAFARAVELRPNLFEAYFNLGAAYGHLNDDKQAYKFFQKAVSLHSDDPVAQYYLGFVAAMIGKVDVSIKALAEAERLRLDITPRRAKELASAYYTIGYELAIQAMREEQNSPKAAVLVWHKAQRVLSKAVGLDPSLVEAHFLLGRTYSHLAFENSEMSTENEGLFDQALASHERATHGDPMLASWSYTEMGTLWSRRGNQAKALELYEKAVEIDPTNMHAIFNVGVVYLIMERWQEAVKTFLKIIAVNPRDASVYHWLGTAYASMGYFGEAEAALVEALRLDPQNIGALLNLGVAAYNQERFEQAEDIFRKALKLAPDDKTATQLLDELAKERLHRDQQPQETTPLRRTRVKGWLTRENMSPLGQALASIAQQVEDSDEPELSEEDLERELILRRGGYFPDVE